jgi:hypothetical protein
MNFEYKISNYIVVSLKMNNSTNYESKKNISKQLDLGYFFQMSGA